MQIVTFAGVSQALRQNDPREPVRESLDLTACARECGLRWPGRCEVHPRASRLRRASTASSVADPRRPQHGGQRAHHPEKMGACVLSTIADRVGAYQPWSLPGVRSAL